MGWKRECLNCDKTFGCNHVPKTNKGFGGTGDLLCNEWTGWVPCKYELPQVDEYVLIQLKKEYAGDENIIIGIYFPENYLRNEKGQWFKGHIVINDLEENNIYAWRPLPKPIEEEV